MTYETVLLYIVYNAMERQKISINTTNQTSEKKHLT